MHIASRRKDIDEAPARSTRLVISFLAGGPLVNDLELHIELSGLNMVVSVWRRDEEDALQRAHRQQRNTHLFVKNGVEIKQRNHS